MKTTRRLLGLSLIAFAWLASSTAIAATDFMALGQVKGAWFDATYAGKTPDGADFEIKADGTGTLGIVGSQPDTTGESWRVSCESDAMTDAKSCRVEWWITPSIEFDFNGAGKVKRICVTNTVLMVGPATFRVGDRKPIVAGGGQCLTTGQSAQVLQQLTLGTEIRTRTVHLDEGGRHYVDIAAWVTPTFGAAIDMMRFLATGRHRSIVWPRHP